jgi:AcrR family transcriptional regulator
MRGSSSDDVWQVVDMTNSRGAAGQFPKARGRGARERILETAYDLFSHQGIRAVGIDTIIARSEVAKMTFYRHFPSKDALVVAFLEMREERWTEAWLMTEVERRAELPADRLLTVFDVFNEWFHDADFEGCAFVSTLLEINEPNDVRKASVVGLAHIRDFLRKLAKEAGVADPDRLARQWHMLMKGSIVAAQEGDLEAALSAQDVARLLLARETEGSTSYVRRIG